MTQMEVLENSFVGIRMPAFQRSMFAYSPLLLTKQVCICKLENISWSQQQLFNAIIWKLTTCKETSRIIYNGEEQHTGLSVFCLAQGATI